MSVTATEVAAILGGRRVLGRSIRHLRDLEDLIREGVPKPALERLVALLAAPYGGDGRDLRPGLRNRIVSRATYQRVERLNLQVSETTERLARLYALAATAFADGGAAARFMLDPPSRAWRSSALRRSADRGRGARSRRSHRAGACMASRHETARPTHTE